MGTKKNDIQNTTKKTKDRATLNQLKNLEWTQVLRKGKQFLLH